MVVPGFKRRVGWTGRLGLTGRSCRFPVRSVCRSAGAKQKIMVIPKAGRRDETIPRRRKQNERKRGRFKSIAVVLAPFVTLCLQWLLWMVLLCLSLFPMAKCSAEMTLLSSLSQMAHGSFGCCTKMMSGLFAFIHQITTPAPRPRWLRRKTCVNRQRLRRPPARAAVLRSSAPQNATKRDVIG